MTAYANSGYKERKEVIENLIEEINHLNDKITEYEKIIKRYVFIRDKVDTIENGTQSDNLIQVWIGNHYFFGRTMDEAIDKATKGVEQIEAARNYS